MAVAFRIVGRVLRSSIATTCQASRIAAWYQGSARAMEQRNDAESDDGTVYFLAVTQDDEVVLYQATPVS